MERKKEDPDISARLQEECRERGWTQKILGEKLGISRTFASQVWNGSVPIGPKNLRRLADLGFDLNWLIAGQSRMKSGITQAEIDRVMGEFDQLRYYTKNLERLIKEIGRNENDEGSRGPKDSGINPGENR